MNSYWVKNLVGACILSLSGVTLALAQGDVLYEQSHGNTWHSFLFQHPDGDEGRAYAHSVRDRQTAVFMFPTGQCNSSYRLSFFESGDSKNKSETRVDVTVHMRVDQRSTHSTSGEVIGSAGNSDLEVSVDRIEEGPEFLRDVRRGSRLYVTVELPNGNELAYEYDLSGSSAAIQRGMAVCTENDKTPAR